MTKEMESKVGLVTGGGSGIGRATALAFVRKGAKVVVADVAVNDGEETVRLIKESGGNAIFLKCDISKAAEVEAMVNKAVGTYGRLDYAFNNAGILGIMSAIVDYPEEIWNKVLSTNLTGVWLCMKYEIPQMLRQGGGAIVNTASVQGFVGGPGFSAYNASKHGVIGITKTVALEYAKAGIRVNAVCPGVIETPMNERIESEHPEMRSLLLERHPVGRFGMPNEVAEAVVWLCSEAASFVTGHALVIDGGFIAQ
jgi:NAD(P)-dependent dehydrogenase (short-subunit alcohol dehydrogenase family)